MGDELGGIAEQSRIRFARVGDAKLRAELEKLVYDGRGHVSIASVPGMEDRTLVVNGFSRSYAMTGWRLGYLAGPAKIVAEVLMIHQHSVTCAPSFIQKAAVAALAGPQGDLHSSAIRGRSAALWACISRLGIPALCVFLTSPRIWCILGRHHQLNMSLKGCEQDE